jgi:predicted ATPase/DNA-binding SARP family transcriptional activator
MRGANRDEGSPADVPADVRVDVLGPVSVTGPGGAVSGPGLGGRRARVALVALALSDGPLTAARLADLIWAGDVPATWPAALRGVIGGLRATLARIGAGGQRVIATTPAGYGLAAGVAVDARAVPAELDRAARLTAQGRYQAVLAAAGPVAELSGDALLPGEDDGWLGPHRRELDEAALRALELIADAAGELGDHHRATAAARQAVAASPLDERAYRALIRARHRAGDRAGVVQAYDQCRAELAEQLGVDPDPSTVQAYVAALGDPAPESAARLPAVTSAFFGRATELAWLAEALAVPGQVTVTGRGGVGKSRLAVEAAATAGRATAGFAGGRLWVPLAGVTQDELVASSVALTLGVAPGPDDVLPRLAGQLARLGRTLLILDGCEAVVDGVASAVAALLEHCPQLSVLVTSRVPLAVEGERVLVLAPLPEAAELLADRVRWGGGQLALTGPAAPFVAELCRRCGGLPLALELVAAQLTAMSPADLLDHLPETEGDGALRAIAASSYELLEPDEACVFRLFGILDGPVALPLIREVAAGGPVAPVRVVRVLRELTARGLLTVDRSGPRWRYQQDDDLHAFARERLTAAGEESAALVRLAGAVAGLLPDDPRAAPGPYLSQVTEVRPSVRRVLGAAIDGRLPRERGLEIAFRLHRYWAATDVTEGRFWLSRLLAARDAVPWAGRAMYALGYLSYWSGDTEAAVSELRAAVAALGQPDEYAARALIFLGGLADDQDDGAAALDFVLASITAAAPFGTDLQVSAATGMGCVLAERADPAAAGYAADAIELCRRGGSAEQLAATLPTAAMICWQVGDLEPARRYIAEAQPLLAGTRRIARVVLLSAAAGVALADGDPEAAVELGQTAARDASELGIDRELPLARAIVARALLDQGELAAAARQAADAVTAARSLPFSFPLAIPLEAAALIILARAGSASARRQGAGLLAAAAAIRARGRRPGPPALRAAVDQAAAHLSVSSAAGPVLDPPGAASQALDLLTELAGPAAARRGQPRPDRI